MLFSYFISCWINWWVYAAQFLDCFVILLTPCIQQRQQRCKTQHNKELESDRDREKGTTEKNNVKLCKAEMTQPSKWSTRTNLHFSVVFFSCHFPGCLRELNKDQLRETIPLKPTICPSLPSLTLLACQSKALIIIAMETEGLVMSSNKLSEQQVIRKWHWWKEFTSLLKLT